MKLCTLILSLLFCEMLLSQTTFSKLINLEFGQDNYLLDFEIQDSFLYATTKHLCPLDTSNNNFITCTGLSKFDNHGILINKLLLDSIYPEGLNRLLVEENKILLSGHYHEEFTGRPTALKFFGVNLEEDSTYSFSNESNSIVNIEGIIKYNDNYYLYGTKLLNDQSKQYSNIIKVNSKGAIVWNNNYSRGDWKNEIYDLQNTIDGNLIYFQYFNDGVGSQGESGFQIIKIDTNGLSLDSFEFEDISIDNPRLLASSDGNVYFTSQDPPFPHTIPSNGRINKIDNDLDSIEWSVLLPNNPFIDGHRYKVYDYLETSEGDVVFCGTVWEEGPDGPTGTPDNHTWNGFIASMTTSGDLKWLHIYRHPSNHPLLQSPDFGEYRPSYLNKIYETANNNFIVAGSVYYDSYQEVALPVTENKSSIWLMKIDEIGCLEDEECSESIILDGLNNQQMPRFQIGTSWTYETEEFPDPIITSFRNFKIIDTTYINSTKVFIIENSFDNSKEYMFVEGTKIFFWDSQLQNFQLNYDFAETYQYQISWVGLCDQDTGQITVHIDSISELLVDFDTIKIQHVSVEGQGSVPFAEVYQNIGLAYGGLRFPVGIGLCDFNPHITKLRCFNSDTINYRFVSYPCDSTWIMTDIEPVQYDFEATYPNPSSGIIYFKNSDLLTTYQLFDLMGRLVEQGEVFNHKISIEEKGLFILKYCSNNKWKVVKLLLI